MRQNLRLEDRPLYFRHAPPRVTRKDYSSDASTVLPFPRARPWECSVYYYWWLFLREQEGYRLCCQSGGRGEYASLYQDFGDVHEQGFPAWWRNIGRVLFGEPQLRVSDPPKHASDLRTNLEFGNAVNSGNTVRKDARGQPGEEVESQARYSIIGRPNPRHLYQRHKLLTLVRSRPQVPLWKLLDISEGHSSARIPSVGEREQKNMIARRYYQEAECIIEYAGRGMFPVRCRSQVQ